FSGPAFEVNPVRGENHNIHVEGVAKFANGSVMPISKLDSSEFRDTSKFRGSPNRVVRNPAVRGGFTMVYRPPYNLAGDARNVDNLNLVERKRSLLTSGGHATGFGHVEVLPRESMLVDGIDDVRGPALGCEAAPAAVDAVTSLSRRVLRVRDFATPGATLVIRGKAFESEGVTVRVGKVTRTPALSGAGAQQTWSTTIPLRQLRTLREGNRAVSMRTTRADGTISGVAKTLVVDRITAPSRPRTIRAAAGNHTARVAWTRPASNGNAAITGYRLRIYRNGTLTRSVRVANVRSTTVRRLANGQTYRFRVSAVNRIGLSAYSPRSNRVVPRR
ncbi:MAG: fibronectin type III domain-containing protein, partial [Stackebrandtia sp.]